MHVEHKHIIPGAGDDLRNLCLSCASCNLSKAKATSAVDPATGEIAPLFNPREQRWDEHFRWTHSGMVVEGLSPVGRLRMNRPRIVGARAVWVRAGVHPPS